MVADVCAKSNHDGLRINEALGTFEKWQQQQQEELPS